MTSVNQWNFGTSSQLAVLSCNVYSVADAKSAYGDLQISFVNVAFPLEQTSFKHYPSAGARSGRRPRPGADEQRHPHAGDRQARVQAHSVREAIQGEEKLGLNF